jgi:KaiC/GvpD/RAD55 family RecA-like ATPase
MPEDEMARCQTGIEGIDNILNGGIPQGSTVILSGSCGTGKTSLSLEFLIHGALNDQGGLFISASETANDILKAMIPYDFYTEDIIKKGRLVFVELSSIYERLGLEKIEFDYEDLTFLASAINNLVKELNIKRLVIDSVTSISYRLKTEERIREFLVKLSRGLSEKGCTAILISEADPKNAYASVFGGEEDIVDGVIRVGDFERGGDLLRTVQVIKMRGTMHSRAKYVLDLTTWGALIVPLLKGGG